MVGIFKYSNSDITVRGISEIVVVSSMDKTVTWNITPEQKVTMGYNDCKFEVIDSNLNWCFFYGNDSVLEVVLKK